MGEKNSPAEFWWPNHDYYFLTAKTYDLNEVCGFFIFLSPKLFFVVSKWNEKTWNEMVWNEHMNLYEMETIFLQKRSKNQKWFKTRFWENVRKFNDCSLWFSLCAIEFSKPATGFPHVAVSSREMKSTYQAQWK